MEEVEIKHELFETACYTCLSVGRNLQPLGDLEHIFKTITFCYELESDKHLVQLCWECHRLLHKVMQFQHRARMARDLLRTGQMYLYGSLSNLNTIVVSKDTDICAIYIENTSKHNNLQQIDTICDKEDNLSAHDEQSADEENHLKNEEYASTPTPTKDTTYNENMNKDVIEEKAQTNNTEENKIKKVKKKHKKKAAKVKVEEKSGKDTSQKLDENVPEELTTNTEFLTNKDNNTQDNEGTKVETNEGGSKCMKKQSKWSLERKLQNKTPKFRLLTVETKDAFKTIKMTETELCNALRQERDGESKEILCNDCSKSFNMDVEFVKHLMICQKLQSNVKKTTQSVREEILSDCEATINAYMCVVCKFTSYNRDLVVDHTRKTHKKIYQCLTCGVKFESRREFFAHYKEWHEKFVCHHCGVSFKLRYCIEKHIRKKHSPNSHTCVDCGASYSRAGGLWLHTRLRHRPPARAYCVECDRSFAHRHYYRWHLAASAAHRHRDPPRVPCPGCDKVFTKKVYMKEHYDLVHLKNYKYTCDKCSKHFVRNADLVKHRRRIHEGILPPRNKICYHCGKGFTTNKILKQHIRTHTPRTRTEPQNKEQPITAQKVPSENTASQM